MRKGVVVLWFLLLEIVYAFPLKLKRKKFKRSTFFKIIERCRVIPLFRLSQRLASLHMSTCNQSYCVKVAIIVINLTEWRMNEQSSFLRTIKSLSRRFFGENEPIEPFIVELNFLSLKFEHTSISQPGKMVMVKNRKIK